MCVFVRLRISPARIKLAALNFARWFIGVLGRESPILGNFAPLEAKIGQIGARRQVLPIDNSPSTDGERGGTPGHALGIGRYTAVPEDGRICLSFGCKRSSYCYAMLPHAQRGL